MNKKKSGALPLILCFSVFLLAGVLLHLLLPDRKFSENENRYLEPAPKLTWKTLFSGSFTSDFEKYITDEFPFRDRWLDLKSRAERLSGKRENNGVFFGKNDTLITRFKEPAASTVAGSIRAVNALAEVSEAPVYLALIPSAAEVWSDRLPRSADTADQAALIRQIYEGVEAQTADVLGVLEKHKAEDIYYRTDHHWTTLGAYYGYAATAEAMGFIPAALASFTPETVSESFYGTVYSSSGVRWVKPDRIEVFVPAEGVTLTRYDSPEGKAAPVYDRTKLETKDKYGMFLGGNTSRLTVGTGHEGMKLLVLRDSYADCELPFFFEHCSEIHVLDLRYFRQSVSAYLSENDFDAVLVTYSLADFVTDTSVLLMGT